MNILEQEDLIKGLPDAALMQEASAPSGEVPQFLVISEIKRRSDMRKRFEKEQEPQGTVKDQIVMEAMGIAPMMPSAMTPPQPPAAPMGAPPMGGMPPQGMPPMAPPQAPKPPMPMGGIASAPQAMPPMRMAQGGIVRMQQGRQTPNDTSLRLRRILASNPGITFADLMSMGFTQADLDRLSNLGYQERIDSERILGDAISGLERVDPEMRLSKTIPTKVKPASDIYSQSAVTGFVEDVSRAAQENMPNYSMIAPAGIGEIDFGMPTRDQARAADRAKVESLRAGLSPSITSGDIDSAIAGMVTERAPRSTAPELFDMGGISDLFSGITQGATNLATDLGIIGVDRDAKRRDRIAKNIEQGALVTPEMTAALDLADAQVDALDNVGVVRKEGVEATPVGNAITELSNYPSFDESNPYLEQVQGTLDAARKITGDISVQGQSKIQTQPAPASKAPSDPDMPTLDFSDLIAEGKQQALANAMIQLGAGVASGDVSKGLAAAGTAAMKGTADARALDMRRRLAEYQAGREDIRRGEEADRFERQMRLQERKVNISESQFTQTLDQASDKLDAEIAKAGRVSKGQLLTFVADIVQESLRNYVPKEGESMEEVAAALSDQLLRKYAGFMDVDVSGLPTTTGGTQTGSRNREDILAQYNVAN